MSDARGESLALPFYYSTHLDFTPPLPIIKCAYDHHCSLCCLSFRCCKSKICWPLFNLISI